MDFKMDFKMNVPFLSSFWHNNHKKDDIIVLLNIFQTFIILIGFGVCYYYIKKIFKQIQRTNECTEIIKKLETRINDMIHGESQQKQVHINDLSYDLLCSMIKFLPYKQLFTIEFVCKKWQKAVSKMLQSEDTFHNLKCYSNKFMRIIAEGQMIFWYVDEANIEIFKSLLTRRPNIKSINLGITIVTKNVLLTIANSCPKLEKINFKGIRFEKNLDFYESCFEQKTQCDYPGGDVYYVYHRKTDVNIPDHFNHYQKEIEKFSKLIGPKLLYCNLKGCDFRFTKIILKHLKIIEEITFETCNFEEDKEIFKLLKSCENLKQLKWLRNTETNKTFDGLITTFQRLHHLNTHINIFIQFKNDLNNLTELTLRLDFSEIEPQDEMVFENLEKLNIKVISDQHFNTISKMKFPNLKYVSIKEYNYRSTIYYPTSFIDQIQHIKHLSTNEFCSELVSSMNSLEVFELNNCKSRKTDSGFYGSEFENKTICDLNVLSKITTLKKIIIKTLDCDFNLLDQMINFKRNSNAELILKVYINNCVDKKNLKKFTKQFDETKELTKINMQIYYI